MPILRSLPPVGIKTKILSLVLGAVAITAVCVLVFVVQTRRYLEAQIVDDQAALARAYAGVVENYLSGSVGAVESLTYTGDLRAHLPLDAVQPALRGVPENVDPNRRAVMAGLLASLPRFEYAFQLAPNGDMVMLEPYAQQLALSRPDFAFRDYYQRVRATGRTAWSDVYLSGVTQQPVVTVATPIKDASGQVQSIFAGALRLDLLAQLAESVQLGDGRTVALFDSKGNPIVYPDAARVMALEPLLEFPLVSKALAGGSGPYAYYNPLTGRDELGTIVPLPSTGWYAAIMVPQAAAAAGLSQLIGLALLMLAAGMLLLVSLGVLLARSISRSIAQVAGAAQALSAGRLDQTLEVRSHDELGRLTESFQGMVGHLRQVTVEIRASAEHLNGASSELLAVVSQQSAGTSEQAAAITQTTSTVEQLRASTEQIAEQAEAVLAMAERATEAASAGVAAVAAAASWAADSRDRVLSNQEQGRALWEQTQQIDDIIATVNDLADQSHVLAINAAIEANRAGEQGKAFAVVATEIRSLAEQSKAATQQVRTILSEIARVANVVLATTEQGARGVATGEQLVAQAGHTIDELSGVILQTVDNAQLITMAVRQHTIGMEQITIAMREINTATVDNLAVTARTQDAAKSLRELARHLDQLVARFTT